MSSNKHILEELERTGEYIFHGSPDEIGILELKQPYTFDKELGRMVEDGEQTIAGTPYTDIAIFRAIVNKKNIPEHYWSGFGYDADKKVLRFKVSLDTYKQIGDKFGYVHVLDKKDFRPRNPKRPEGMEWRSGKKLKPLQVIKVSSEDLPTNIQIKNNMVVNFEVKVDIEKDARNIWQGCNQVSHGTDWKERAEPIVRENVVGKTEAEAYKWLMPYLKQKYQEIDIDAWAEQIQKELIPEYPRIVEVIEEITQKPLYLHKITLFVTTFNRCPYDWGKGYIWIVFKKDKNRIINNLLHEMLHFQFHRYYGDKVTRELGVQKFEAIKEGMTPILNDYLPDWIGRTEETYTIYEPLAEKLLKLWHGEANRQFDKFVTGAVELAKTDYGI